MGIYTHLEALLAPVLEQIRTLRRAGRDREAALVADEALTAIRNGSRCTMWEFVTGRNGPGPDAKLA